MIKKIFNKRNLIIISLIILILSFIYELLLKYYPDKIINIELSINIIVVITLLLNEINIIKKSITSLKNKDYFSEYDLTLISSITALAIGKFNEALAIIIFFSIGEMFEEYSLNKSKKSLSNILNLKPKTANKLSNNTYIKVDPESLKIDDIILVKPGEIIPVNGIIIEGESYLDLSSLTGESKLYKTILGEEVLSGTINKSSILKIKVNKEYKDSTMTQILNIIENPDQRKTKSIKFIKKFAKIYTPLVIVLAFLTMIIPSIYELIKFKEIVNLKEYLYRGASILVISCPCSLLISIPMAYIISIGNFSKHKILIKENLTIDNINKIKNIYFDKTGTLTEAMLKVSNITLYNKDYSTLFLKLLKISEKNSNHPIAKTLYDYCENVDTNNLEMTYYQEIEGKGIICTINDKKTIIGNKNLMIENNIFFEEVNTNETIVYVSYNDEKIGYIILSEKIKPYAVKVIDYLQNKKSKKIILLSGDNNKSVKTFVEKVDINNYYSDLLPVDKSKIIKEDNCKKMYVGDGINDTPSMVNSDIAISMGIKGSDIAIEYSDIVLMDDNLISIIKLFKFSKKTKNIILFNLIFAISTKVLAILSNSLGLFSNYAIYISIFADVGVTIICCLVTFLINYNRKIKL